MPSYFRQNTSRRVYTVVDLPKVWQLKYMAVEILFRGVNRVTISRAKKVRVS